MTPTPPVPSIAVLPMSPPPQAKPALVEAEAKSQFIKEEMSNEESLRRDKILTTPFEIKPRFPNDLPMIRLNIKCFLEQLTLHFKRVKLYYQGPSISGGTAVAIPHPTFPYADLDLEYPVNIQEFNLIHPLVQTTQTEEYAKEEHAIEVIVDFVAICLLAEIHKGKDWEKKPRLQHISRSLTNSSGELDAEGRNLLALNYLKVIRIKDDSTDKTVLCQIQVGNKIQINIPLIDKDYKLCCRNVVMIIDKTRVGIFENWISYHVLAKKALAERRCDLPDPDKLRHLPFRILLYQSKGILPANEREVTETALRVIQSEYDAKVIYERTRPINTNPLIATVYEEYVQSHFPEGDVDQMADFMNWVDFLLKLPEGVSTSYYQAISHRMAKKNLLAAFIKDKPFGVTNAVMDFLHGILFIEWTQENPAIRGYEPGLPHLTVTNAMAPRYVTLGKTPLQLVQRLIRSWETLEKSCDQKQAHSLTDILKALKCTNLTFTSTDKNLLYEGMVQSAARGRLSDTFRLAGERPETIYDLVRGVVNDYFLDLNLLQHHFVPVLQGTCDETNDKERAALVKICQNVEKIGCSDIQEMTRLLGKQKRIATDTVMTNALSIVLMQFLVRSKKDPSVLALQAGLKLFAVLQKRQVLSQQRTAQSLSLLMELFQVIKKSEEGPKYLSCACEFLFLTRDLKDKPEGFSDFSKALSKYILDALSPLLESLQDPEKEKLAYQCAFALMKTPFCIEMPRILEKLVLNAVRSHGQEKLELFRNRRFEILTHTPKPAPSSSMEKHLKHYLIQEIAEILRHPSAPELKQAFIRFSEILFKIEESKQEYREAKAILGQIRDDGVKNVEMLAMMRQFIFIASQMDLEIAQEMVKALDAIRPGAAKYNALILVRALILNKDSSKTACAAYLIYKKYLANYLEEGLDVPTIPLTQALTIYEIILAILTNKLKQHESEIPTLMQGLKLTLGQGQKWISNEISSRLNNEQAIQLAKTIQNILILLARHPQTKSYAVSLWHLVNNASLLPKNAENEFRLTLLNFEHIPAEDSVKIFTEFLESSLVGDEWPNEIEITCIRLMKKCLSEGNEKVLDKLIHYFLEKKLFARFQITTLFTVLYHLFEARSGLFFFLWNHLPPGIQFTGKHARCFANKFLDSGDVRFYELIYPLYAKSKSKDLFVYCCHIKAKSKQKNNKVDLMKFIEEIRHVKESEEQSKEKNEHPDHEENLGHMLLQTYLYATFVVVDDKSKGIPRYVQPLCKLIDYAKKIVSEKLPQYSGMLNDCILMTCRKTEDDIVLIKLANICLLEQMADPAGSIVNFVLELLFNRKKVLPPALVKALPELIRLACTNNWLAGKEEAETAFLNLVANTEKLPFLEHVTVAFRMSEIFLNSLSSQIAKLEKEEKAGSEKALNVKAKLSGISVILVPVAHAFNGFKSYELFPELDQLGRKFCDLKIWKATMISILKVISEIARNPKNSPESIKAAFQHFKLLFPIYNAYCPNEIRVDMIAYGSFAAKYSGNNEFQAAFEEFYAFTKAKGLYGNAPNYRVFPDLALVNFFLDFPSSHPLEKVLQLQHEMMDYIDLDNKESQCALNASWPLVNLRILYDILCSHKIPPQFYSNLKAVFRKIIAFPELSTVYIKIVLTQCCYCLHIRQMMKKCVAKNDGKISAITCTRGLSKHADFFPKSVAKMKTDTKLNNLTDLSLSTNFKTFAEVLRNYSEDQWQMFLDPKAEQVLAEYLSSILIHYFTHIAQSGIKTKETFGFCHDFYKPAMSNLKEMMSAPPYDAMEKQVDKFYNTSTQRLQKLMDV